MVFFSWWFGCPNRISHQNYLERFLALQIPWHHSWEFQFSGHMVESRNLMLFSHSVVSDSLQPHELQHARFLHYLRECAQTHVHWVSDAIQPDLPLSPSSPPTPSMCLLSISVFLFLPCKQVHLCLLNRYISGIVCLKRKILAKSLRKTVFLVIDT